VAQVWGTTVLTDRRGPTTITPVPAARVHRLVLAWNVDAASLSGRYHRELRQRFQSNDPAVRW
jgi:hypothetical protein